MLVRVLRQNVTLLGCAIFLSFCQETTTHEHFEYEEGPASASGEYDSTVDSSPNQNKPRSQSESSTKIDPIVDPIDEVDDPIIDEFEDELDPAAEGDPNIIVFRIKAGTGNQPWNDQNSAVMLERNQVLRVVNEDVVEHRLHTNGAPCPHGMDISPGETADCLAMSDYDSDQDGPLYDHNFGTSAEFWIFSD